MRVGRAPPPSTPRDRELGSPGRADHRPGDDGGGFRVERRRQPARSAGEDTSTGTCKPEDKVHAAGSGLQIRLVSNVVSFAWVRGRPPRPIRHSPPTSRTVVNPGERRSALLESVLGATPQEFESPILRHPDQAIHKPGHTFGLGLQDCVVSLVVSFIYAYPYKSVRIYLYCHVAGAGARFWVRLPL